MVSGPSKKWRHLHKFHDLDHGQKTEVVDQVDFELPYSKLFEGYAYNQLRRIFDHRKIETIIIWRPHKKILSYSIQQNY